MVNRKAFINLSLLGLSLILSWSLIDYFLTNKAKTNLNLVSAADGVCEYVKWPNAELNAIPVSIATTGAVIVTSSPIYVFNANIGIGTDNPRYKLDVVGTTSVSSLCLGGVCRSSWPTPGTNYWQLNGDTLYPSSVNYNVGIGTTTVNLGHKLTVDGIARINDVWTNYLVVTPTSSDDQRGIYFKAIDTGLHIYRQNNRPKWTIITNPVISSAEGIGFKIGNEDIILSIKKRSQLTTAMTDDGRVITGPIGVSDYNVGIGTDNPWYKLDVAGNLRVNSGNIINEAPMNYPYGFVIKTGNNWNGWARQFAVIGPNDQTLGGIVFRGSNSSTLDFIAIGKGISNSVKGSEYNNFLTIRSDGKVGIGTNNPKTNLHIEVPGQPDSFQLGDSEALRITTKNYFTSEGPSVDAVVIEKTDDDPIVEGGIVFGFSTSSGYDTPITSPTWAKGFYSVMTLRGNGNIGIGVEQPRYRLHVVGTTSVSALCFDGKDCRSSWPTTTSIGGANYWRLTNNVLTPSSTNWNVGIGTDHPGEKLTVVGNVLVLPYSDSSSEKGGDTVKLFLGGSRYDYVSSIFSKGLILGTFDNIIFKNHKGEKAPGEEGKELMRITSDGRVGIGTTTPVGKFDVDTGQGSMKFSVGQGSIGLSDSISQNRLPYIQLIDENNKRAIYFGWGSVNEKYVEMTMENGYDLRWNVVDEKNNLNNLMVLKNYGYLGINTLSPQYRLHVVGTTSVSALCFDGKDCRSSWPTTTSVGGANYWRLTNNVLTPSSTNWYVGIGTAGEAIEPLHVVAQKGKGIYFYSSLGSADLKIYESTSSLNWLSMLNRNGFGLRLTVNENMPGLVIKRVTSSVSTGLGPLNTTTTGPGDSNTVTVDAYVGIGTYNPAEKLHVMGNVFIQPTGGWSNGTEAKLVLGDGYNYLSVPFGGGVNIGSYNGQFIFNKTQPNNQRKILEISEE